MRQLAKHLKKNGYLYEQVHEEKGIGYIYKQVDDSNGRTVGYEVFKHIENTRFDCVSFPSNEAFGIWAFSVPNLDRAFYHLEKFKQCQTST
jgi:hypothetical protein